MKEKFSGSKVISAEEAVRKYLHNGDWAAFGGFVTNRKPYALVREIIKQGKKDLYVESGPAGGDIDMLIGAGCVKVIYISYIANSGFTQVCRRFRKAVENNEILFDDYSLDTQTIAYHGAALGLSFVPIKNQLGSDLINKWGISEEVRKKDPKLQNKKYVLMEDPFYPGSKVCCVPTPKIDTAFIHVQKASPDGTCRIEGPEFQDVDIALGAKHCIVSCEELVDTEVLKRNPELNSIPGIAIDAVVHAPCGAHPAQCFNYYDYDGMFYQEYDKISANDQRFAEFLHDYVYECKNHFDYLDKLGAGRLMSLRIEKGKGYVSGLKRR